MLGTIVNSLAVICGCLLGLLIKGRLKEKISKTIMDVLGLCTLYIGISGVLKGDNTLLIIICITLGSLIGESIDIDKWIERLGCFLEGKFKKKNNAKISISEGFISSSLLFCVGAMAIVGSLESGLKGNHDTLFAKSMLDFISSIIFTSTLGIGVIFSAITVFLYQGVITLGANLLSGVLTTAVISDISAVGSLLIVGLALNILGISKIKIANMLPSIFLPILFQIFI